MHTVSELLEDLQQGRMVVLVDDESRENEGDLVCAAETITAGQVNFMLREARGILCVSLSGETCDRLELSQQSTINTTQHGTAFTVSVDAHERFGITTGVSADERAKTIQVLVDPATRSGDLARPGHVNPLRARDGGVLVRAGQTEGSIDLMKLAGLRQASAIIEIMNEDGSMARRPQLDTFCEKHQLKMGSVADIIQFRLQREKLIERIDEAPFESEYGQFKLIAYRSAVDPLPHVALVCGGVGEGEMDESVLVRMHSQNLLGDVFGDAEQPTGDILHASMKMIREEGCGAIVYLRHEGMGKGLLKRLHTLHRPDSDGNTDLPDHSKHGSYGIGSQILRDLGIRQLRLLTNHPFQPPGLDGFGLSIGEFVPLNQG